jgi:hypothetical protein
VQVTGDRPTRDTNDASGIERSHLEVGEVEARGDDTSDEGPVVLGGRRGLPRAGRDQDVGLVARVAIVPDDPNRGLDAQAHRASPLREPELLAPHPVPPARSPGPRRYRIEVASALGPGQPSGVVVDADRYVRRH